MKVIITIPAYNEEKTIGKVINSIKEVMNSTKHKYEILVVDDGSADNTKKIAEKSGAIVYSHKRNKGLAETFKTEMDLCLKRQADIIIHTDADGQYPPKYIPLLIKEIENGADLVLGERFGKGKYSGSLMNKIGNIAFAKVFSNLLNIKINDTTTGFRAFTQEVAKLPIINNFTYTQEQLIRAGKAKMKIISITITTEKTRKSKLFKNPFSYASKAWINILRIYRDFAPLKFFGFFGGFFILTGTIIGIFLIYNVIITGRIGHLPLTILSALLILIGLQIILFGFLADMKKE